MIPATPCTFSWEYREPIPKPEVTGTPLTADEVARAASRRYGAMASHRMTGETWDKEAYEKTDPGLPDPDFSMRVRKSD